MKKQQLGNLFLVAALFLPVASWAQPGKALTVIPEVKVVVNAEKLNALVKSGASGQEIEQAYRSAAADIPVPTLNQLQQAGNSVPLEMQVKISDNMLISPQQVIQLRSESSAPKSVPQEVSSLRQESAIERTKRHLQARTAVLQGEVAQQIQQQVGDNIAQNILKTAPRPTYVPYDYSSPIVHVSMREYFVIGAQKAPEWLGTFALADCIGTAVVGKQGGQITRVGLAHVDVKADLSGEDEFISYFDGVDELTVYMVASIGSQVTAQKLISLFKDKAPKVTFYADLTGSQLLALNTRTGQITNQFDYQLDMNERVDGEEALNQMVQYVSGLKTPSPLLPSHYQYIYNMF